MEQPRPDASVTELLLAWRGGDEEALPRLMPLVYGELRRLAQHFLGRERAGLTLSATALVHEAFLRLTGVEASWQDRAHFLALAARLMRRILVDQARARARLKRGAGAEVTSLDARAEIELGANALALATPEPDDELEALDRALERLAQVDPRKAKVVDLLFFGGLTYDEAALALGISRATLHRELKMAKAWLHDEIASERESGARFG